MYKDLKAKENAGRRKLAMLQPAEPQAGAPVSN